MIEDQADTGTEDPAELASDSDGAVATQAADISPTGLDAPSAADESVEPASTTPTGLDDSSAAASTETVDELEDRVRDLQGAMEKIQSGDLDGAERAIEALEERIGSTRD